MFLFSSYSTVLFNYEYKLITQFSLYNITIRCILFFLLSFDLLRRCIFSGTVLKANQY